jgi:hypothetical protein
MYFCHALDTDQDPNHVIGSSSAPPVDERQPTAISTILFIKFYMTLGSKVE